MHHQNPHLLFPSLVSSPCPNLQIYISGFQQTYSERCSFSIWKNRILLKKLFSFLKKNSVWSQKWLPDWWYGCSIGSGWWPHDSAPRSELCSGLSPGRGRDWGALQGSRKLLATVLWSLLSFSVSPLIWLKTVLIQSFYKYFLSTHYVPRSL